MRRRPHSCCLVLALAGRRARVRGVRVGTARRAGRTSRSPSTSRTTRSTRRGCDIEAGHDGSLGQRRAQHPQRHAEPRSAPSAATTSSPASSYVHTFADAGTFAYYCTLHGTPTSGQRGELGVGDATVGHAGRTRRRERAAAPTIEASGRTIRVPADAETIQAAVDRAKQGDLVLVSPGVYKESVTIAHRRHRAARRRPQPHHPRRRVQARERRVGRRRRRRRGREPHRAQLHRERLLLERRARVSRFVPHRVPQRRLRRLRVRLAVRGRSSTRTRRAVPTPASTSASAIRATR